MEKLVGIAEFDRIAEAYVIKSRLEAEGIECFFSNEAMSGIYPGMGFTKVVLKVRLQDSIRAMDILYENPSEPPATL